MSVKETMKEGDYILCVIYCLIDHKKNWILFVVFYIVNRVFVTWIAVITSIENSRNKSM